MTLVEIMISLVLLGIVSGVLMRVILRQQRFYQGVNQIMTQRGQLRQATSILPVDLRSLSSVGNDIIAVSDASIEFMVNIGTGVVCQVVNGAKVVLPPENLVSGQKLTSWYGYGLPPVGATVYIYNDSNVVGNEDDRWQKFTLTGATTDKTLCLASFTKIGDLGQDRTVLTLVSATGEPDDPVRLGPVSQHIDIGAPVRVLKRVKYALYQASDGQWYLGFADWNAATSAYNDLEPVSGPYDPYTSSVGTSGLGFRYYDVDGIEIAAGADSAGRSQIARVDLIARARTSGNVRTAGIQNGASQQYRDSLAVSVMLRNRN
jgi:hypothetical protein